MSQYWTACRTQPNAEHKARSAIEELGIGTFLPTYARIWYSDGQLCARENPLVSRYVFVNWDESAEAWHAIKSADGVQGILSNDGHATRIPEREMERLVISHASGDFDSIQPRNSAGQFATKADNADEKNKKKRRPRPRRGAKSAKARRKKARRERMALRDFTKLANQVPA